MQPILIAYGRSSFKARRFIINIREKLHLENSEEGIVDIMM